MDQVFAVRHVCEKYLANRKDVFLGVCGFGKDLLVRLIRTACGRYYKSVCSWEEIFESSAEFLCR